MISALLSSSSRAVAILPFRECELNMAAIAAESVAADSQ
jgi:hypothetical protein